ncbi:MAG: hypothetical protein IH926_06525, partial [Proteobacteria bacterium]|nr:hypothetical protein [Pseudomonadota bacterium]
AETGPAEPLPRHRRLVTSVGRVLFSDVLADGMPFYNCALGKSGCSRVIDDTYARLGRPATLQILDDMKELGFKSATLSGLSIGITDIRIPADKQQLIDSVRAALYCAKTCSYAQGMALLARTSGERNWNLPFGEIARIWKAGCIIRAKFLRSIQEAYAGNPGLANLLLDPFFKEAIATRQQAWRQVVARGQAAGVALPAMSASLAYYDAYRAARLPANLVQAQRDLFGAHTYERLDKEGSFHTQWD